MSNTVAILLLVSQGEVFDLDAGRPAKSRAIRELNLWLADKCGSRLEAPYEDDHVRGLFGAAMFFVNLDAREAAAFIEQARTRPWRHPESLQILAKASGAQRFRAV